MLRRVPIVGQVIGLVSLAVLLASTAMIAQMLLGPPPRPEPTRIHQIAELLEGRPLEGPKAFRSRLVVERVASLPAVPSQLKRNVRLEAELRTALGRPTGGLRAYTFDTRAPHDGFVFGQFLVTERTVGDEVLTITSGPDRALRSWRRAILSTIGLVLLAVLAIGWLLAARMARPIRRLGEAAKAVRAGEAWTFEAPSGPPEVRATAEAMLDLHHRTLEYATQRVTMLGAISHDIGTPLARLAFRAERLPEDQRKAAMDDIATIQRLLADSLTLARGWQGNQERVDLGELLADMAAREASLGHDVRFVLHSRPEVLGHHLSLERMVQNLLDNALRYGSSARIALDIVRGMAELTVEDDGSGFPDIAEAELLKPYVRGEASRNSDTGGSGLGLAIVAQAVERHGGTIRLGTAKNGGAKVTVRLPLA